MSRHFITQGYYILKERLTDEQIRIFADIILTAGETLGRVRPPKTPRVVEELQLVREADFQLLHQANMPVIRMSSQKYVDQFFEDGTIRLGTLAYYAAISQAEIGDSSEGQYIIASMGEANGVVAMITEGYNYYVLCCTSEVPSKDLMGKFEHDTYFEIIDNEGFSDAIASELKALSHKSSRCLYTDGKIVTGELSQDYDFSRIDSSVLDLAAQAKYFIKPADLAHQQEFRFIWEVANEVNGPIVIKCPEAIQYCRKR